jgi:hypothetical protein
VDMAEKLTSNEETLRPDGMVAGDAPPVPLLPPHAITTSPTINSVGTSFANLMLSPLKGVTCCLLPGRSGARVRRHTGPTQPWLTATRAEHCSWLAVCQENVKDWPNVVRTLDKLALAAMIACGGGQENDDQTG